MEQKQKRIKILKEMEQYLADNIDEGVYYDIWKAEGVPDGYDESDFANIAEDDLLWVDAVCAFATCCKEELYMD